MINIKSIKKEISRQLRFFKDIELVPEVVYMAKEIYDILKPELDDDKKISRMDISLNWLSGAEIEYPELAVGFSGENIMVEMPAIELSKFIESIPEEFKKIQKNLRR